MNNDNLKSVHRTLISEGYTPPEYEQFEKDMEDDNNLQRVYKTLKKEGYTPPEYDTFRKDMGFGVETQPSETPVDTVPDVTATPQPENGFVQPEFDASKLQTAAVNEPTGLEKAVAAFGISKDPEQYKKNLVTPGTQEWRTNKVNQPGENPYNGRTYGEIYDEVIRNYGQNIAKQDIDPYAEARAQIIQAGITDELKPEEADNLALNIRHGYANRYAYNVSKEMISTLPDQVPNIDDLVDGLWYTRDMQARVNHEAARLGLRKENYVNYYLKPHIAKALSDRYGYDVESAKHIAGRLLSQEEHTTDAIRRNEAAGVISEFAGQMINDQYQKLQEAADKASRPTMLNLNGTKEQKFLAALENWQATDPEKVWQQLKPVFDQMGSWLGIVGNEELFDKISQMAEAEGIPVNAYIDQYVIPTYTNAVQKEFERIAVEREMPEDTYEYILDKMGESLVGNIGKWMIASDARRRAQGEALQRTDMGQGEYKPGFGARVAGATAAMLPDIALPYGGPFGLTAAIANRPVAGIAQHLITSGWKPLFARMAQSSASGMASLGAFEGVKGAIQGAINPEGYESILAEDKRNAFEILGDMIKGGFEHGIPSAVMGATMVGGPLGQKISNGRGLLANMLGWGTQVGVDAAGATALSAIQNMPKIIKGDLTADDLTNEFLENVGTFTGLGLHGKAKDFASLAEGGRSINGVPFSKSEVQTIEDVFGKPMRDVIEDVDKLQKSRSLITKSRMGITAETEKQERNDAIKDAATYLFGNIMKSYQVSADMKVRMCQAFNVPLPEYALKPKVLETFDEAIAKSVDAGWIEMMNYEFNRPGGVADKLENDGPKSLSDYELTLRLLFQDNKRYNEIVAKQEAGEELTTFEKQFANSYNQRLEAIQADYFKMEKERLAAEFEQEKGLKRGTIQQMIDDLKQGKGVSDPAMLEEFEAKMGQLSQKLDEYKQAKEAAVSEETEAPVAEVSVTEEPKINKAPVAEVPVAEEAPITEEKTITNELPTEEIPPVEIPEETVTVDPQLLVNDETGDIVEVTLVDGRKAYIKSGDPANEFGRVVLVDEQGEPIKLDAGGGYTIDRVPTNMIARDENGNPLISQPVSIESFGKPTNTTKATAYQPKVDTTKETVPVVPEVKADEKGQAVYEESPVEATLNDLRTRLGSDEEVAETVDDQISDLTDELTELKKTPKGKAKKHTSMNEKLQKKEAIKATQQKLDYWNSVKEALNKPADVEQSTAEVEKSAKEVEQPAAEIEQKEPVIEQEAPVTEQAPTAEETAQMKIAQGNIKSNLGKNFEFQNQDGTRSIVTLKSFKGDDGVEVMRQDFDAEGNPKGSPYSQELKTLDVSGSIINGFMKPALTPEEQLREQYKGRKSIQDVLDVVTDEEMQKIIQASQSGDSDAFNSLIDEYRNDHVEDLILKDRDERNAKVAEIMDGPGTRESKLRRIRKIYQEGKFEYAVTALEDDTLAPVSVEGIVADLHSRQPKKGEGPIAYFSYTAPDGHEVIGMQDESGHGKKTSGDTKGYAPWLAPQGKGMSLTQYAENLRSQMTEAQQEQYDVQDVRNAVINLFGSAEKPSDITTMSIKNGVLQAEQAARRMEDHWIDNVSYQKVSHDENSFAGRLAKAKETTNTEPTEAQKEKGNYKKGHVSFGGYDFVIENPEGSMRRGEADGKKWEQKMNNTYGYILGKYGKDGDHLDMFINDGQDLDNWNGKVYVVDQVDPKTGLFDEHKVMYGFNSEAEARDAYLSNYEKGWKGLGAITGVSKEAFDKWLDSSKRKLIRFADHSITKEALEKQANEPATDADIELAFRDKIMDIEKNSGVPLTTDMEEAMPILNRENGKQVDQHKAYHGSGAEFDAFDHSHMGEGEGYQTFGYGTYVTEVPNIAKGYAEKGATKKYNRLNPGYGGKEIFYKGEKIDLQTINPLKMAYDMINNMGTVKKAIEKCDKFVDIAENPEMKQMWRDTIDILKNSKKSDFKARMADLEGQRYVYDVEIPDDNGENYLDYELKPTDKQVHNIVSQLYKLHMEDIVKEQRIATMIRNANSIGDIIDVLHQYIGGKATAKLLHDAGYVGTKYPTNYMAGGNREGTKNYVIYDENDAKITDTTKFFKTNDGYAYGFTYRGKIYIDPSIATSETPIHEYGHLWAEMKRQSAPEEWNHIKQTLLADKLVEPFVEKVKRDYPELTGDGKEDDFVEEVLTQFSGKHGAEKLRKMAQEIKKELGDDATAETIAEAAIRRVKSVLNDFWKSVCGMMGWKYTNAEEIADAVLRDLLNGVNPAEKIKEMPKDLKSQGEVERTLMGVHNISEEKLKKALKLGGLANPSMAVIDTKNGIHTDYGEISLIPRSSLIDAKTGRNAGTYAGDAWTPTYPNVTKEMTSKGEKHKNQIAKEAAGGNEELAQHLARTMERYVDDNENRLHLLYLLQKGIKPDLIPESTIHTHDEYEALRKILGNDQLRYSSDGLTKEQNDAILDLMMKGVREKAEESSKLIKDEEKRKKAVDTVVKMRKDSLVDPETGKIWFAKYDTYIYDVLRDEKRRQNPKIDWYKTDNEASYRVAKENLAEDYETWKEQLFGDEDIAEKLFAGWTPDGYKKYVKNTVANASRLMNKEKDTNAYGNGGLSASKAVLVKKLKSLAEIRKYRHLIKKGDDIKEQLKQKESEWFDIIEQVSQMQKVDSNPFINNDIAEARLQEAMEQRDPIAYMNKEYGYHIDKDGELASQLMNFMEEASQIPVKYFETKFKRPVGIEEFAIAVVPTTTSPEVIKALEDKGLEVHTYEKGSTGDENDEARKQAVMDAVQRRDDILFQKVDRPKKESIEKLRNSNPAEIKGDEITPDDDYKVYRKNALEYGKKHLRGSYKNEDTGNTITLGVSRRLGGLREILEHDYKDKTHIQSVAAIPQIIEKSIYIDTIPNEYKAKHPNVDSYDYYVCGLKIGGEDYTVKAVVANSTDGLRYYDHKLTQIEKGKLLDELALSKTSASSDLSSVSSQGDAVAGHPANESGETSESPVSGYKDKRLISILQEKNEKSSIQGLEGYTEDEIKQTVSDFVKAQIANSGADAEIVDMKIIGSRITGKAKEDSDLDVLVEYKGKEREDGLFNILNDTDEPLTINGIKVDINPITKGKSGTIDEFLKRNKDYGTAPSMSEDFPRFSKVRKPTPHQMNEEIRKKKEERNLEVAKKRAAEEGGIKEPNRQAFEVEALKRYDKDVDDWKQRHGLSGERPRTDGPEMDKWLEAEANRKDPKPNVFDYTGDKEYREAYDDYLKKIEKYKPDETLELTKDDVINEREMQVRTPAQKITTGIATTLARDYSGEQASDAVREGVIERRRNIEDLSADDSLYINNLKEQTDNLAKELSGDKYDGDDAMSRLMNAVEARKKGKQHISGKDIRDALPFIVEAPMRRHDIARDINDVLAQVKSPCRVSGEDLKAAKSQIDYLREDAAKLLEINKQMSDEGRSQMTDAEKQVEADVKRGAQAVADAINTVAEGNGVPLTADDVMAALSYFAKRIVPKGLKVNEDMPELQSIINGIRDWYRTAYTWLDEAGMRKENVGYFENYVNHVWSSKKSDPDAYDTLVANRQPTTSRNMKQRQVRTYMEGIEAGLVPEFSEITDMMGDYSKKNILAWANKKMLNDLSFIDVIERNDEGEVTAIFPMMSSKAPSLYGLDKYQYYEVPGVGALWVYKDAADNFSQIFEQYEVGNAMKVYDNMASLAKKIELSWSGFHAGALSEVYAVQNSIEFGPKKTAQYFYKYLIKDCLESGLSPAYANPEAYRSAAKHFVKLGATDDYSAPAVQNMSDTMVNFIAGLRNNLKGRGVIGEGGALAISPLELAATAVKLINEGSDKVLWTWLHDGLKIATFRMMEDRTNSAMEARFQKQHPEMSLDEIHKMKEYQTELNKQLDRDGQYVNDMFGGQHWELINISPKVLRRLRRFLLSPDWLMSTQRHFLGAFGYGDIHSKARLRDFNKFYKAILGDKVEFDAESLPGMYAGLIGKGAKAVGLKGKNINEWAEMNLPQGRIRRAVSSLLCYAIGVNIFYDIANNIVNAIMRKWDEEQEEQKEKENEGYVSKYKLMYPDGMKWFDRKRLDWNPMHMFGITNMIFGDYGMEGNALGKKTHVFAGHYDEGAEIYMRTGKQFKEFPDFWENEKGELEFPRPLINRLMGKANPNIRMLYNTLNYYTRWDKSYDDKQLEERIKKFSDNKTFVGVTAGLTKLGENYKPFWVPTQEGKNWVFTDTFFPSSKGFSAHKAREYFEQFMRAGDQEGYMETVRACILNGMSDEKIERAIKSAENGIKAEQRKQAVEDQQTLEGMMIEFNGTNNLTKRKALYKKIYTELGNETPKAPKTYDEFQEWFTDYLNGVDRSLKVNDKYLERAMAQDMAEEARISQLKHRIDDLQGEIKDMENSGVTAEQIKAYSEQPDNMRLLKANDIINAYKNDRKNDPGYDFYKKELGKKPFRANGELIDDAWRMRKIREMRQEMLKEIEKLGK